MLRLLALAAILLPAAALAQDPPKVPVSPHTQVDPDGSVTFRLTSPGAEKVEVHLDLYNNKPIAMTRGQDGVWSATTAPLPPEFYGYSFTVDGRTELDPLNPDTRFNYVFLTSQIMVPGDPPRPWELTAIPHGRVDHYTFTTHIARNLPQNQSAYVVYTPPGYDAHRPGGYPVLYLLHGWSDNQAAWTDVGRANLILDSLIDSHKAVPMIVVMPFGYGDFDFVTHGPSVWGDLAKVNENARLFSQELLQEVVPAVESEYNVAKGRDNRAIAGLSMGGQESLYVGLNHTDQFAWVVGMSAAIRGAQFGQQIPGLQPKQANLRLLWIACGKQDSLLQPNEEFIAWARAQGLHVTAVKTPLAHVWLTWRENLLQFAPLLFRK